jgi:hypothetical protein
MLITNQSDSHSTSNDLIDDNTPKGHDQVETVAAAAAATATAPPPPPTSTAECDDDENGPKRRVLRCLGHL